MMNHLHDAICKQGAYHSQFVLKKERCIECGGNLLLRRDRPSKTTIYTVHFRVINIANIAQIIDEDATLCNIMDTIQKIHQSCILIVIGMVTYFISSQGTALELQLLTRFDFELLIGQVSCKQNTEIYNATHGYSFTKKTCSLRYETDTDDSADYLDNV